MKRMNAGGQLAVAIGVCLLLFAFAFVYALFRFDDAFDAIQKSREDGTYLACVQRNQDRTVQRSQINEQIADTQALTAQQIAALDLNITKAEALADLRERKDVIPIIDCGEAVERVRATAP